LNKQKKENMMDDVTKKINDLFKDSEQDDDFFETVLSNSNISIEDFTPEERKEVEDAVRAMQERRPKKPKKKWKWSFWGRFLFKLILFIVEFAILAIFVTTCAPFIFNTEIDVKQALAASVLLTYIRFWYK
jgi:hypothetical protein